MPSCLCPGARLPAADGTAPGLALKPSEKKEETGVDLQGKSQEEEEQQRRAQEGARQRPSGQRHLPGTPRAGIQAVREERRDRSGPSRQEPRRRAAASSSRVDLRGKSQEEEQQHRAQEWTFEARAKKKSSSIELKSGPSRQEPRRRAAASSSRVDLRGKSQEEEQQHRAQEWTFEARAKKKKSSSVELKREHGRDPLGKGTSLAPPGQGSKPSEKKEETGVDLRGKSQEEEQQHRAQEWTFEARAKKKKSSSVELKREHGRDPLGKGTSLAPPGQGSKPSEKKEETGVDLRGKSQEEEQQHRAQEWTFEARAKKKKSSSVELKREHGRDPLGKGTSLAPPGQGSKPSEKKEETGVDLRGKSQEEEQQHRAQEWTFEARAKKKSSSIELKSGPSRQEPRRRAAASSSRVDLRGKSQEEEEQQRRAQEGARQRPSGQRHLPGTPRAGIRKSPAGTFRLPRLALCWATSL
ncbi:trichohyalin-like [Manacus candei]|uniref:trichohyalin-like n=1 Tax=Manacus candei TaxID=415023 RepID=UPI002225C5E8|nr:trichohyalin-like [Manacus candei]